MNRVGRKNHKDVTVTRLNLQDDREPKRSISWLKKERQKWLKAPRNEHRTVMLDYLNSVIKVKQTLYFHVLQKAGFMRKGGWNWGQKLPGQRSK